MATPIDSSTNNDTNPAVPPDDTVDDDVDFGDQFANLMELADPEEKAAELPDDSKSNTADDDDGDDDVDFGDQFNTLNAEPRKELAQSLLISDIPDESANAALGTSIVLDTDNIDSNFKSANLLNTPSQFMSVARDGPFNLGATDDRTIPKKGRASFKNQLIAIDGLDFIDIDEESGAVNNPLRGSITGKRASFTIDERMRKSSAGKHLTKLLGLVDLEALIDEDEKEAEAKGEATQYDDHEMDPVFTSHFAPDDMRCLALVAHNHMKPAMKDFVLANQNLLCKFRLTGTNTTMTMLREVFAGDPSVKYGPTCTSGPLGGDAELVAIMCTENLGGCVFFQDPMSSHPHSADIECLSRQANVHNILMMPNPATAFACMSAFRIALKEGRAEMVPSFFKTLSSPSVAEYKVRQAKVVERNRVKK